MQHATSVKMLGMEGMHMIWSAVVMTKENLCAYRVGPKLIEPTLFENVVTTGSRCLTMSM